MEVPFQDAAISSAQHLAQMMLSPGRPAVWKPLHHQLPPRDKFYGWLLLAGRGAGKTDACADYVVRHVNGPPCMPGPVPHWISIIAPTLGDAATACFSGPSGIRAHDETARMGSYKGGLAIKWPNGSEAKLFGARSRDDVERLRAGGNRCLAWLEEVAAWRYLEDSWDQMRFGLRTGPNPHWIGSTTPKPRKLIKKMNEGAYRDVVITRGTMYDNPHLPDQIKEDLETTYGGTTLGAQELYGKIIEQDEHALWQRENLESDRVTADDVPDLKHVSVGVDPSGGAGEQGIVVVGKQEIVLATEMPTAAEAESMRNVSSITRSIDAMEQVRRNRRRKDIHGFVLADYSCRLSPDGWGRKVVRAAIDHDADDIVIETNFGGDMAIAVVQGAIDAEGVTIPVRTVTASRGKKVRAEPVAALSSRGKWHMVGTLEELEDQMCTWTDEADYSPDRLDAMVWPAWYQKMVRTTQLQAVGSWGGRAMNRQIG